MAYTEEEKKDYAIRVENHLLDGVDIFQYSNGWMWTYFDQWNGHKLPQDEVIYGTYEKCVTRILYLMRNSQKLSYAKNMAAEGIRYMRIQKAGA